MPTFCSPTRTRNAQPTNLRRTLLIFDAHQHRSKVMAGLRSMRGILVILGLLSLVALWKFGLSWQTDIQEYYTSGEFVRQHIEVMSEFGLRVTPLDRLLKQTESIGYSAVVVYLVTSSQLRELLLSLSYLNQNVPMRPWPIVLMYGPDLDDEALRTLFTVRLYEFLGGGQEAEWFLDRIQWNRIELKVPSDIEQDKDKLQPTFKDLWPDYHQQNAFLATEIFDQLKGLTYFMRLDSDSYIYKPLCYDPFDLFHEHNRTYAHNLNVVDTNFVPLGLWSLVDEYANDKPEIQKQLKKNGWEWSEGIAGDNSETSAPMDYNGFEIMRLEDFKNDDVRGWFSELKRFPERLYKYGWNSAAIRYATLNMFYDIESDVEEFCGMDYWHNGARRKRCSCTQQILSPGS